LLEEAEAPTSVLFYDKQEHSFSLLGDVLSHACAHAGLMLVLLYGREGLFAPVLRATGFKIVFAFPGSVVACLTPSQNAWRARWPVLLACVIG
jgi:hypothetical protein